MYKLLEANLSILNECFYNEHVLPLKLQITIKLFQLKIAVVNSSQIKLVLEKALDWELKVLFWVHNTVLSSWISILKIPIIKGKHFFKKEGALNFSLISLFVTLLEIIIHSEPYFPYPRGRIVLITAFNFVKIL